jgi:histidyl-tRNA synthetase
VRYEKPNCYGSNLFIRSAVCCTGLAQATTNRVIPPNAKVFVSPMTDGFDEVLKAPIEKKKVPIEVVVEKDKADFQITGQSDTQKASTAKKVIMWDWRSNEQASIQVNNLKTGEIVFAYSLNKLSSAHGKRNSAEACAKHLKEKIESKQ